MIFAHPTYDVPAGPPIVSDKTGKVLGVRYEAERPQVYWFDEDYKNYQAMIDNALPGMANDIKNWSKKEDRILFHSHSEKTIGSYYLLDISDKKKPKMEKLLDLAEWIDPAKMSPMKPIQYTARDGLVIHGFLTIPNGSDGKNLPLIVHPHGGPTARDYWGWNADVQFLANRGYAVFQPNFRGSTGYGNKLRLAGFREWGGKMQNDITDGVKYLIAEGIADATRIGIYGASYGGYATMAGLCFTPELYRCGINYVGVTDIDLILKEYPLPKKINDAIDAVMIADRKQGQGLDQEPIHPEQHRQGESPGPDGLRHERLAGAAQARPHPQARAGPEQHPQQAHHQGQRGPRLPQRGQHLRVLPRGRRLPRAAHEIRPSAWPSRER